MSAQSLSPPRKRPHPDEGPIPVETPTRDATVIVDLSGDESPLSSVPSLLLQDASENLSASAASGANDIATTKQPQKRRKLTPAEKEQQRLDKEAKDKAREATKAQKELAQKEKKEKLEEERRTRDEAARAKKEQLEEKRRAKELEQARKDEEKAKKDRSQLRLNAFFVAPKTTAISTTPSKLPILSGTPEQSGRRKSISATPEDLGNGSVPPSPSTRISRIHPSKSSILPFELPSNTTMASTRFTQMSHRKLDRLRQRLDAIVSEGFHAPSREEIIAELKLKVIRQRVDILQSDSVKHLMELVSGTSTHPIDLTSDSTIPSEREALEWLRKVPVKYLEFGEDVRPPYCGTYTKRIPKSEARRLAINPRTPKLPEINYQYDSEAEWEEPEEGEDILSDGEEDLESNDDGEDMDGFLDDEEAVDSKRRMVGGDLEPVNSGLVWENASGVACCREGPVPSGYAEYKMCFLLEPSPSSIDPFSTAYWAPEPIVSTANLSTAFGMGTMYPPRLPLSVRSDGMINHVNIPHTMYKNSKLATVFGTVPKAPEPQKRMVAPEQLEEFKAAIRGSDLTKIALIEHLKKQFPDIKKDLILNTLNVVAHRVGPDLKSKIWELK
ncbi:hypothetical protein EJ05DRAFT_135488 [Pseudovirgaria hyperparasitica]|uniref:Chromatin assembly factor 1 subunit A n=1 Tax=Pseudovirgaria hyperparasitica TaxID=470096 RepID=A0A6A6VYE4_9PEZI|nr:uncharacterized protein EJ05DRAFT_135488 [Pseudovirgaria hyperparasitica]KAF2754846.1 hypothetical protein EJ05DRAFT_135488 [Pseudovirgaria hyperparasitica]